MRLVCDCCNDITNIEADRMEIQGDKLMVHSRGRLVYVADLGQIMLAKLTPGREETRRREQEKARMQGTPQAELPGKITWEDVTP